MLGVIGAHVVAAPFRGLGVGGALLDEAVRQARAQGLRLLEASLHPRMHQAVHLYERHRFRPIGKASSDGRIRYERRLGGPT
jgi:GNAT superfamily N-acetyltransferase